MSIHHSTKTNLFCISLKKGVGRYLECKSSQHLCNVWLPVQGIFVFTHRCIANRWVHIIYDTGLHLHYRNLNNGGPNLETKL